MQINAVNSVNFGKSTDSIKNFYSEHDAQDDIIDAEYVEVDDDFESDKFEKSHLSSEELAGVISKFDETASKINSNVHPATIVATLLAAVGVAKGASKIVPIARRATVALGEQIAVLGTKAFGSVANAIKKDSFKTDGAIGRINNVVDKLMINNQELAKTSPDEFQKIADKSKVIEFVQKHTAKILGSEKAESIKNLMVKNKIVNGAGLFDALAALGIGLSVVDKASDKTEQTLDKFELANAIDDALAALEG